MATTEEDDLPRAGALGGRLEDGLTAVSSVLYGRARRPLWPVALILAVGTCLVLGGLPALLVGVLALGLLALWVGSVTT